MVDAVFGLHKRHSQCSDHHEVAGDLNLLSELSYYARTTPLSLFIARVLTIALQVIDL